MARRMKFAEFRRRLESRRLSNEDLEDYLEIDPTAPRIRVRFRPGTLEDLPPDDYDVDNALYRFQLASDRANQKAAVKTGKPHVVAEGDSWFLLPLIVRLTAIAPRIHENGRFHVHNIAKWGDTLRGILTRKEYLDAIKKFNPEWFIVSAGGNDLQEALEKHTFLFDYDPARPLEGSITTKGEALLDEIEAGYQTLLHEVTTRFPGLSVLCYGYDYPRPEVAGGFYIGRYLVEQKYPPQTLRPLVEIILDRLNRVIKKSTLSFQTAKFINCLRVTDPYTWIDDMHPHNDGFKALASKFESGMVAQGRSMRRALSRRGRAAHR